MIKREKRNRLLSDRFAFADNEEVLVNALDLCDELIAHDQLKQRYSKALETIEILKALVDCQKTEYRRFDIKG